MKAVVTVMLKPGVLDPQGKAVADALRTLGFAEVADARVGRHVVLDVEAADADAARRRAAEACDKLLANPVTEDYVVEQVAPAGPARG